MEKCDKCGEFIEFARLCPLCAHYEKERLKQSAKKCAEQARKAEALVREQENQIDILSTTLAMYCSPYYDMQERAEKAEALVRELLEVMMSVAYQECGYEENGITKFDSMAIGARMELLLTLIEHGRLEEINSFGRRVIAKLPGAKEVLENANE